MSSSQNSLPFPARKPSADLEPSPGRRALLVASGEEAWAAGARQFIGALEAGGLTLIRRVCAPAKINDLILSMRKQVDCVVLAGGDGLLGAGAIALRDSGLPLGILPLGTSNDFARRLGIPLDPAGAAATILAGHKRRLNLGAVNGRPFFNVASVGLTVEDARHLHRAALRSMGGLAYLWKAARLMLGSTRFAAIIHCGGAVHRVRTMQITIGNGHVYEGGMAPGTERPGSDHILGVYSLEPAGRWQLLFLDRAFTARAGDIVPEARIAGSSVVEVVTRLPRPISADGEVVAMTPARFSIIPHAIEVFVPAPRTPELPHLPTEAA